MTRTIAITFLALSLTAHEPIRAQEPPPVQGPLAGAVLVSLAGEVLWLTSGGLESSGPDAAFALTTVLGSTLGAWALSGDGDRPAMGHLLVGASAGLMAGVALAAVVAGLTEAGDAPAGSALPAVGIGFAVGQGTVTALLARLME